ncbi:MAG: DNA polymerase I [Candidatus Zapsychrus exili]|nr:DNA polymerase I [Candidatus Zapsychrus exili]
MAKPRLFLIDAHTICYRSFYAVRGLSTSKGQPTNAVFGVINILKKILRDFDPEYVAVCFDSKKKTHRQEKFAEYKIQRPKMPDELIDQMPIIKDVIKAYNLSIFELGGFEADDIIATLSKHKFDEDIEVVIVSEDKDLYQLLDDKVKFFSARKDKLLDCKDVEELLGFAPEKMVDFIGFAGDQSDNIPGVLGVGEVTAKKLINQYGDLEGVYEHLDEIKPEKLKEKLTLNKDTAFLSKELAVLVITVPFQIDLKQLKVEAPNNERLFELFKELEFKKLADEVGSKDEKEITLKSIQDDEALSSLIKEIKEEGKFAFLVDKKETEDLFSTEGLLIATRKDEVVCVSKEMAQKLGSIFEDKAITKITHNLKGVLRELSDIEFLSELEKDRGDIFDVMVAGYLIRPAQGSFSVTDIAWNHLKITLPEQNKSPSEVKAVYDVYPLMTEELKSKELVDLFNKIEMPLTYVLSKMEKYGVALDLDLLAQLSKDGDKKIKTLTADLYEQAGEEFNLNSPKQLSHIMFDKLSLPPVKKTKTGFSTDEGVLTKLAKTYEFPKLLLEYRQIAKLKSTYIDALPKLIDEDTGRIHAQFNQTGTETGRLSSSKPNLQNIPIRTELGRQVRKAIVPSKGRTLLAVDYSQIELRILAHLSGDEMLTEAFKNDQDIHSFTASLIFDIDQVDVTKEMRNTAKRVNFGIVYGMSSFGLSKDLNISPFEAQEFIDKYFLRYPKVKEFMTNTISECEQKGFVMTLLNRRRYIPDILAQNNSIRQFAQRQAINTPVQGSAADLMKIAMIDVENEMIKQEMESKMLITVHDELVFDVVKSEEEKLITLARDFMEGALKLSVPIKVSIKAGDNWLEMKEI